MHDMRVFLGKFAEDELDEILKKSSAMDSISGRIKFLSDRFVGLDYRASTLAGGPDSPEILVVDLEGVDCFTLIDYVEAMRMSDSFPDFLNNLVNVRYKSGEVSFKSRKHFFSDWATSGDGSLEDVTREIGVDLTGKSIKVLNLKEDGTYYLPGIEPAEREIFHIPAPAISDALLMKLSTGDYIGIYSEKAGLDVSHVGIFIRAEGETYLRHASSQAGVRKVVDEDFRSYIKKTPGIIVFRPV